MLSLSSTVGGDFYSQVVGILHFWLTYSLVTVAYSELATIATEIAESVIHPKTPVIASLFLKCIF